MQTHSITMTNDIWLGGLPYLKHMFSLNSSDIPCPILNRPFVLLLLALPSISLLRHLWTVFDVLSMSSNPNSIVPCFFKLFYVSCLNANSPFYTVCSISFVQTPWLLINSPFLNVFFPTLMRFILVRALF